MEEVAEEAVVEAVAVEAVAVEAVEEEGLPPHNNHSNNRMLHPPPMLKLWESSLIPSMATVPKQKTSSRK